ncbi:TetR family transcriptional regulator [Oceaniferula spumae]|uniref:TetR family transcriptional regulator n=1 Tax=Oceaniferula spumae TaxID=2979115 RepID=A0AAT9FI12_9BACT
MATAKLSTKEKILTATEHLLAEHGFDAVSLRDITTSADVNVAAVNYHFGSKDKLFEAVQCRHINPVNEERLRLLEKVTKNGRVAEVREILDAFMRPFITMVKRSEMNERMFLKLMGRCMSDQQGDLPEAAIPLIQEMMEAYTSAMTAALPDMPMDQLLWRLHYSFGVMAQTLIHADTVRQLTNGACGDPDMETQLAWMIDFCYAGFVRVEGETA